MAYCALLVGLIFNSCESSYKEIIYFDDANFIVSEMSVVDSTFSVTGSVKNEGQYSFKTPWYFTYEIRPQGGDESQVFTGVHVIESSLECADSLVWDAQYYNGFFCECGTTDFRVENFEAYYILQ